MVIYKPTSTIISESLEVLQYISQWTDEHERMESANLPVLIGGWAVHAYNPWYGSMDIDLVTSSRIRQSLKHYLKKEQDFIDYRLPYTTQGNTVRKVSSEKQSIIIDFATYKSVHPFEGSDLSLSFSILHEHTIVHKIHDEISFRIPDRSILLLLKLKAAWDRHFRIKNQTSHDIEWERGKLLKDYGDIIALLDPERGGRDVMIEIVGLYLARYKFLKECFIRLIDSHEPFDSYGRMNLAQGKEVIQNLLEMIE